MVMSLTSIRTIAFPPSLSILVIALVSSASTSADHDLRSCEIRWARETTFSRLSSVVGSTSASHFRLRFHRLQSPPRLHYQRLPDCRPAFYTLPNDFLVMIHVPWASRYTLALPCPLRARVAKGSAHSRSWALLSLASAVSTPAAAGHGGGAIFNTFEHAL